MSWKGLLLLSLLLLLLLGFACEVSCGDKLHGMTYLFEDDMLPQEGPVVLPHRQLWVVLQRSNHIHHILL